VFVHAGSKANELNRLFELDCKEDPTPPAQMAYRIQVA
tara:strand:- start:245 stop:358 length:114 start_codon:yes stop_codon:yes gene_type:complete